MAESRPRRALAFAAIAVALVGALWFAKVGALAAGFAFLGDDVNGVVVVAEERPDDGHGGPRFILVVSYSIDGVADYANVAVDEQRFRSTWRGQDVRLRAFRIGRVCFAREM